MLLNLKNKWFLAAFVLTSVGLIACGDDESSSNAAKPVVDKDVFENASTSDVDVESYTITMEDGVDSFVVNSLQSLGGSKYFIALDDDPYDPMVDWDQELTSGSVIYANEVGEVRIVALDEKYRVAAVWTIKFTPVEPSSSSEEVGSCSSSEDASSSSDEKDDSSSSSETTEHSSSSEDNGSSSEVSSSSETAGDSSSSVAESSSSEPGSSSSEEAVVSSGSVTESSSSEIASESSSSVEESSSSEEPAGESSSSEDVSSSSVVESSSSETESSSSEEEISSSSEVVVPGYVNVSALSVDGASLNVYGNKIFVEYPYDAATDLKNVLLKGLDETLDLLTPKEMEFASEGVVGTYTVVAGMQLPGTNFASRDQSFWGTTSAAMGSNKTVSGRRVTSSQNATFSNSKLTLTSREVSHVTMGGFLNLSVTETHGKKLAGGFYFAGNYAGTSALDIYQREYEEGYADDEYVSDISADMTMGRPFTARPVSFDVTYSYSHVANLNEDYPQQSLIYVILANEDGKVVASGKIIDTETVATETRTVLLDYGSDNGLLESEYPIPSGLTLGTGDEDVAMIYVMFASSAYAYIVDGGAVAENTYEDKYRGGKGAQLILDEFKLNY